MAKWYRKCIIHDLLLRAVENGMVCIALGISIMECYSSLTHFFFKSKEHFLVQRSLPKPVSLHSNFSCKEKFGIPWVVAAVLHLKTAGSCNTDLSYLTLIDREKPRSCCGCWLE